MNLDKLLVKLYNTTTKLHEEGRHSESLYVSEKVAVQALNALGLTYCTYMKDYTKALQCFYNALKIDKSNWLLWSNICHVYSVQEKHIESLKAVNRAIKFSNGMSYDCYYNAGVTLTALGRIDEAIEMYRLAEKLNPSHSHTQYNLGLCMMRKNVCEEALEKYEYRFETSNYTKKFKERFVQEHWDGRPFKRKSLVIYSEQGLGDFVQNSRFIPFVKQLGGKVIVEVQEPLVKILEKNKLGIDEIISRPNSSDWPKAPKSDYCISVCSLMRVLRRYSFNEEIGIPYLKAPKKPKPKIFDNEKIKIGLCWCGNPDHARDHTRSMPISACAELASIPNSQIFSLVKGVSSQRNWNSGSVDLNQGIENFPIIDLSKDIKDYNDLAHFINHMDCVVTVDTGLVHLAGAIGKKAYLLLGRETDWRWGDNTNETSLYPSVQIIRYKNNWKNSIQQVVNLLSPSQTSQDG